MTRLHNGKSYVEIATLPVVDQLKLQGVGIDRTKIVSLHTCCYRYAEFIETAYYNELQILWKTK